MKISMLGHKQVPSREGGVEIVVEELATRMVALGHEVTCYNRGNHLVRRKGCDQKKEYKGVQLKTALTLHGKGIAAMSFSVFGGMKAAIGNYDIVHFHAEGSCVMLWLPKLFGKRCIVTIHGLDHRRAKWGKVARAYIRLGEKCAVKYADEIIVLSEGLQKYFQDTYGRKTSYIPNGVNRPKIKTAEVIDEKYGFTKDSYILFLGRLVPEKGIQYLIEAYKEVRTEKKLVIAGKSSDTDRFVKKLKKIAKSDERIVFAGFVQGQLLEELYSNSYMYVLPSDLEGMPLSLLEAMSYGNCCLVSDIPECMEVVGNHGLIFRKSSVSDLKRKLQEACDHPELVRKLKKQACDFICQKYDWDEIVQETLSVYRRKNNDSSITVCE